MTGPERMTSAEFRASQAAIPVKSPGSARGDNRWDGPRTCDECGQRVWLTGSHASFKPLVYLVDDVTGVKTVRHASVRDCA